MKYCFKCKTNKILSEFSKDRRAKDRLQPHCKLCNAKYRQSHKIKIAEDQRGYQQSHKVELAKKRQTPRGKKLRNKSCKKYREEHIEEVRCRSILNEAVRCGKIKRPNTCESCFKECKPEGHHEDYSRPFDVDWLCIECHKRLHREVLVCQ